VVRRGDEVLVVGPGPVGLLAAQVARAAGGDVGVRGTARDGPRLEVARELGFEASTTDDEPVEADVVIECSGKRGGDERRARSRASRRSLRPDRPGRQAGHAALRPRVLPRAEDHLGLREHAELVAGERWS
jgi:threonine dehydrogenase-like Zn-dependent dehydrogenase